MQKTHRFHNKIENVVTISRKRLLLVLVLVNCLGSNSAHRKECWIYKFAAVCCLNIGDPDMILYSSCFFVPWQWNIICLLFLSSNKIGWSYNNLLINDNLVILSLQLNFFCEDWISLLGVIMQCIEAYPCKEYTHSTCTCLVIGRCVGSQLPVCCP